ncbi:MAG: PD-(D/E)XK nuclease family protein [Verrucomicrobiota bacterium]
MSAKVSPSSPKRAQVSLRIGGSVASAWENVLLPWCENAARVSWQQAAPTLVVVPYRSHAYWIKGRLLEHGISVLGIRFVSPAELRELLAAKSEMHLPLRQHLRLLLSIAAEECMELPDSPVLREKRMREADFLAAKSVARSPDHLLRMIDRLGAAGWDFSATELGSWREVEARFQKHVAKCGFELIHLADRRAVEAASHQVDPLFANILVTGFNASHWPLWPLLRAAVASTREATVLLDDPPVEARDLDETWVGSWEELFGEAKPVFPPVKETGESLFSEAEMRGVAINSANCSFVVGADIAQQAQAIAAVCLRVLADEKCTRLGIVFAKSGALARLVARTLERLEIPHNDGLAHPVPGLFEAAEWRAWLELQRSPRIESFLRFFNCLTNRAEIYPDLGLINLERILRHAYAELLIDDLDILRAFCAVKDPLVADVINSLGQLPSHAPLAGFLQQTQAQCARLGWTNRWREIANRLDGWIGRVGTEFSRALYLRWLEEIALSSGVERSETGNHPYARVQLLTVPQACGQQWSHLIFAGWNEGAWPPPATSELAREEAIAAFNQSARQFNRRATRRGRHGEGHLSIRDGQTLYLGPFERRQIALFQFTHLIESASEGVTLAASLVHEDAPERFWNPSECFTQLYHQTRNEPLTQAALQKLQRTTVLLPNDSSPVADVQQTLIAFNARRDPSKPVREYDFALRPNESYRPQPLLSVSELQEMVSAPAIVWMKRYLGVEAPEDSDNPWAATTGKWVHAWLASIGEKIGEKIFAAFPPSTKIDQRIRGSSDEHRNVLQQLCDSLGKTVPDWWNSGWLNALYLARHLGWKIAGIENWKWMAAEMWIGDRERPLKIADNVELLLRGKIDLLLSRNDAPDFAGQEIWIADYKTGSDKKLNSGDLHDTLVKGKTLQLGLYALAVRELGAAKVDASIIAPAIKDIASQLSVTELAAHTDIFADLAEMQRTGVFGMKGQIRPAFGYGRAYPLATLQIDGDILEDKWQRTHKNLVLEKEEWMT